MAAFGAFEGGGGGRGVDDLPTTASDDSDDDSDGGVPPAGRAAAARKRTRQEPVPRGGGPSEAGGEGGPASGQTDGASGSSHPPLTVVKTCLMSVVDEVLSVLSQHKCAAPAASALRGARSPAATPPRAHRAASPAHRAASPAQRGAWHTRWCRRAHGRSRPAPAASNRGLAKELYAEECAKLLEADAARDEMEVEAQGTSQ